MHINLCNNVYWQHAKNIQDIQNRSRKRKKKSLLQTKNNSLFYSRIICIKKHILFRKLYVNYLDKRKKDNLLLYEIIIDIFGLI